MKYDTYLYFPGNERIADIQGDPMDVYQCAEFMHELLDSEQQSTAVPIFSPTDLEMPKLLKKAIAPKKRHRKAGAK